MINEGIMTCERRENELIEKKGRECRNEEGMECLLEENASADANGLLGGDEYGDECL